MRSIFILFSINLICQNSLADEAVNLPYNNVQISFEIPYNGTYSSKNGTKHTSGIREQQFILKTIDDQQVIVFKGMEEEIELDHRNCQFLKFFKRYERGSANWKWQFRLCFSEESPKAILTHYSRSYQGWGDYGSYRGREMMYGDSNKFVPGTLKSIE